MHDCENTDELDEENSYVCLRQIKEVPSLSWIISRIHRVVKTKK